MGILSWIIFGALAGWIASLVTKTDAEQGVFGNIIVGILGAIIGGFLVQFVGGNPVSGFNVYSLLVAIAGSVLLIVIRNALTRR